MLALVVNLLEELVKIKCIQSSASFQGCKDSRDLMVRPVPPH